MTKRKFVPMLTATAAALLISQVPSLATLTYDLRITALNGVAITPVKSLPPVNINDAISITIYIQVTGAAGGAGFEGISSTFLSLVSDQTPGKILGDFGVATVNSAFGSPASRGGTPRDTNADGFMDRLGVGTTAAAQNTAANTDIAALVSGSPLYNGTPITDGQEFTIATTVFTVRQVGGQLGISVNPSIFTSGIGAARFSQAFAEDAATITTAANRLTGFNTLNAVAPNTGGASVPTGSSVLIGVPEPSAFGMVLLGSMGLLGFKRMGGARRLS